MMVERTVLAAKKQKVSKGGAQLRKFNDAISGWTTRDTAAWIWGAPSREPRKTRPDALMLVYYATHRRNTQTERGRYRSQRAARQAPDALMLMRLLRHPP
jgi:hypothetical protein